MNDTYLTLSNTSVVGQQYWTSLPIYYNTLYIIREPNLAIYTDANLTGCGVTDKVNPTGGFWHNKEIAHIVLELRTIFYGIKI